MSRSQDDPIYGDLPPCWGYCDQQEHAAASPQYPQQHPHNIYSNEGFQTSFPAPTAMSAEMSMEDHFASGEDGRMSGFPNYTLLDVSNVRLVGKVMYDENRQRRFVIPVDNQYELFERTPSVQSLPPTAYSLPSDYSSSTNMPDYGARAPPVHSNYVGMSETTTSNFINDVVGNWVPNTSGTYSPFGQNFPLNHPSAPTELVQNENVAPKEPITVICQKNETPPRRTDQMPLGDTSRKRIVAEVKPMRPSYSDVLAKNNKTPPITEPIKKTKNQITTDKKVVNLKNGITKIAQVNTKISEEIKQKTDKGKAPIRSPPSSGSDSGDFNNEETEKLIKNNKRAKTKSNNISGSWSSLHNGINDGIPFESSSDFFFIENPTDKPPKKKKEKVKNDKHFDMEEDQATINHEDEFLRENSTDTIKMKKKKDKNNGGNKTPRASDKKKTNAKVKRGKAADYAGVMQRCVERWTGASWRAVMWFGLLLVDICHMSMHLSFDLLTSAFTQTYVSCQAVWRGGKDWASRLKDSRYLQYIDNKLGDTPVGFWRKIKWFKKAKEQSEQSNTNKTNSNIPLPATGEEAMKRLLACKGKDPYSILGVKVSCTDDEIKRYYRRQAFLVHPDKNQQPGAEEAFKILQHAFELIGEPERREAFDRRTLEHKHVEAAWSELSTLLAQLHDKMEVAANTIRCTNCGRRHKRVITDRPCYAARYCSQCKIRHSAKEGDIWAECGMWGLLVMYYACMDGAVYQITQWASCQKKNLRQLKPNCHVVQYRIVLGNKAGAAPNLNQRQASGGGEPNLEEFLNNLYGGRAPGAPPAGPAAAPAPPADTEQRAGRRHRKKT